MMMNGKLSFVVKGYGGVFYFTYVYGVEFSVYR